MDLSTEYLGLRLKNPLVAASSPLTSNVAGARKLEDAGAAAVVLPSLFEEEIIHHSLDLDHHLTSGADSYAEALTYVPEMDEFGVGPDGYLELVAGAKRALEVPVIASLNGVSREGWTQYAALIEQAGADAIELNVYYLSTEPQVSGAEVEQRHLDILRQVLAQVRVPVAVKLSPYFSAVAHMAERLAQAGASALVLFNRFYQPDFDLEELEPVSHLELSRSWEMLLSLRWVAILFGRLAVDLAITGGVHTHEDVLKAMMAGARVTLLASKLLAEGAGSVAPLLAQLTRWMEEREYDSISRMQGSMSLRRVADPAAFTRANYLRMLHSWPRPPRGRIPADL